MTLPTTPAATSTTSSFEAVPTVPTVPTASTTADLPPGITADHLVVLDARRALAARLGRLPTPVELACETGLPLGSVQWRIHCLRRVGMLAPVGTEGTEKSEGAERMMAAGPSELPASVLACLIAEQRKTIDAARAFFVRFGQSPTPDELAKELGQAVGVVKRDIYCLKKAGVWDLPEPMTNPPVVPTSKDLACLTPTQRLILDAACELSGPDRRPVRSIEIATRARTTVGHTNKCIARLRSLGLWDIPINTRGSGTVTSLSAAEMAAAKTAERLADCRARSGQSDLPAAVLDDTGDPPRPWKPRPRAISPDPRHVAEDAAGALQAEMVKWVDEAKRVVRRLRKDWEAAKARKAAGEASRMMNLQLGGEGNG